MTVKEIAGVRELTAHECSEINGGDLPILPIVYWLVKTVGGALVSYGVWKGLDNMIYS